VAKVLMKASFPGAPAESGVADGSDGGNSAPFSASMVVPVSRHGNCYRGALTREEAVDVFQWLRPLGELP
jgi:hypothetical protein